MRTQHQQVMKSRGSLVIVTSFLLAKPRKRNFLQVLGIDHHVNLLLSAKSLAHCAEHVYFSTFPESKSNLLAFRQVVSNAHVDPSRDQRNSHKDNERHRWGILVTRPHVWIAICHVPCHAFHALPWAMPDVGQTFHLITSQISTTSTTNKKATDLQHQTREKFNPDYKIGFVEVLFSCIPSERTEVKLFQSKRAWSCSEQSVPLKK